MDFKYEIRNLTAFNKQIPCTNDTEPQDNKITIQRMKPIFLTYAKSQKLLIINKYEGTVAYNRLED